MTKRKLGVYPQHDYLGAHVYINPGARGAEFRTRSGKLEILIGIDYAQWSDVLSNLLHELVEWNLVQLGASLQPEYLVAADPTHDRRFFFTHDQFTETMARVGQLLTEIAPDLARAYNQSRMKGRQQNQKGTPA